MIVFVMIVFVAMAIGKCRKLCYDNGFNYAWAFGVR